jgi:hypothetical protein
MSVATQELLFSGQLLKRGFWLYVWEITAANRQFYYVGRTGDSSSLNAQSPFARMGQHLGFKAESNALRRQLEAKSLTPEECTFRLVAHGPIMAEGATKMEHRLRRDRIAAMEKALACAMAEEAGYQVLNSVSCRIPLDEEAFSEVRESFSVRFPKLVQRAAGGNI